MKGGAEPPTVYLHDFDGNLAAEADGDTGTILTEYVYNGASRLAMADHASGSVYFFHNDQLGTPELMTDSTNTAVWEAAYDAFGEAAVNPASTVTNNFRFPGQYYDAETGLHYNRHRYYDPKTGRYLTPDPIGLAGGINPYVYVDGDPVNGMDPYGLQMTWALPRPITIPWDSLLPWIPPGTLIDPLLVPNQRMNPADIDMRDTRTWPKPPTDRPCQEGEPSRGKPHSRGEKSLWDDRGGEWRIHKPDDYHPDMHWDYKAPEPNAPWNDIPIKPLPIT